MAKNTKPIPSKFFNIVLCKDRLPEKGDERYYCSGVNGRPTTYYLDKEIPDKPRWLDVNGMQSFPEFWLEESVFMPLVLPKRKDLPEAATGYDSVEIISHNRCLREIRELNPTANIILDNE